MTVRVDFVQGADALAPGIFRVQKPLLETLASYPAYDIHRLSFPTMEPRRLFPYLYGLLPAQLLARHSPLVHIGNASYAHVIPLLKNPVVITCHHPIDRADLEQGGQRPKPHWLFHLRACLRGLPHARLIVCDSAAVAKHLATLFSSVAGRLRVVYPGISPIFQPPLDESHRASKHHDHYVLYVGSEQTRKNLIRLVEAVAAVRRTHPELRFIKVGRHQSPAGRAELLAALERENMRPHTEIRENLPDTELAELYQRATVTVLPSLEEGFGFPPLEAMACGCPAIVSNRGSLPEVTAGDALVIDPLDVRGLARAIARVVGDESLWCQLAARGRARASSYTWQRAAAEYAAIYGEALGRREIEA